MKKRIFITFTTVNSKMWVKKEGKNEYHESSIDELKRDIEREDVTFVNVLDNLALCNYLREAGVEVNYQETVDYIHAKEGEIIYEFYGDFSLREIKSKETIPEFKSIAIRRHESLAV